MSAPTPLHQRPASAQPAAARPGLGVDVVDVAGLGRRLLAQPGLAEVLFTSRERALAAQAAHPLVRLAASFAAKEAFVKALRRGLNASGPDAWLQQLELGVAGAGRPALDLGQAPRRALARRGLAEPCLALAEGLDHCIASVLLVPVPGAVAWKEGA